ncbi:MAG TPA: hypothetical protein VM529_09495 [Gemmata sp.]|nr:hypothetical protein [Gemmata sp.]
MFVIVPLAVVLFAGKPVSPRFRVATVLLVEWADQGEEGEWWP